LIAGFALVNLFRLLKIFGEFIPVGTVSLVRFSFLATYAEQPGQPGMHFLKPSLLFSGIFDVWMG
jgi:hypothetical protein